MDYREAGLATFAKMMGDDAAERLKASAESDGFLSGTAGLAADFAFGGIWSRPGLEMKLRSVVVISVLIANRDFAELRNHIRIGIRNGLTETEIEEILIQAIPYVGFPAVASASGPVIETLREFGLAANSKTPAERKLL